MLLCPDVRTSKPDWHNPENVVRKYRGALAAMILLVALGSVWVVAVVGSTVGPTRAPMPRELATQPVTDMNVGPAPTDAVRVPALDRLPTQAHALPPGHSADNGALTSRDATAWPGLNPLLDEWPADPLALPIGGQVLDAVTLKPVSGAAVIAMLGRWPAIATTTVLTDERGRFNMPEPGGHWIAASLQLIASHPDYATTVPYTDLSAVQLARGQQQLRRRVRDPNQNSERYIFNVVGTVEPVAEPRRILVPSLDPDYRWGMAVEDSAARQIPQHAALTDRTGRVLHGAPPGVFRRIATLFLFPRECGERIRGVVRSSGGQPIEGAVVRVCAYNEDTRWQVSTNSAGYYEFPPLAVGACTLVANADGFVPQSQEVDGNVWHSVSPDQPWTVKDARGCDQVLDFDLQPTADSNASLWGTVKDTDGRPVHGALVRYMGWTDDLDMSALTDAAGTFRLPQLVERPLVESIVVTADGFLTTLRPFEREDHALDVVLRRAVTLSVRLVTPPVTLPPGMRAWLHRGDWPVPDGLAGGVNYEDRLEWLIRTNIWAVQAGTEYTLKAGVELPGQGVRLYGEVTITTPPSGELSVDLPLQATPMQAATIRFVTWDTGEPVEGLLFGADLNDAPLGMVRSDRDGLITLPFIAAGSDPSIRLWSADGARLVRADDAPDPAIREPIPVVGRYDTDMLIKGDDLAAALRGDLTVVTIRGTPWQLAVVGADREDEVVAVFRQVGAKSDSVGEQAIEDEDRGTEGETRRFHAVAFGPSRVQVSSRRFEPVEFVVDPADPDSLSRTIQLRLRPSVVGAVRWPGNECPSYHCDDRWFDANARFSTPISPGDDGLQVLEFQTSGTEPRYVEVQPPAGEVAEYDVGLIDLPPVDQLLRIRVLGTDGQPIEGAFATEEWSEQDLADGEQEVEYGLTLGTSGTDGWMEAQSRWIPFRRLLSTGRWTGRLFILAEGYRTLTIEDVDPLDPEWKPGRTIRLESAAK